MAWCMLRKLGSRAGLRMPQASSAPCGGGAPQKLRYLVACAKKRCMGRCSSCPSCGWPDSVVVDRKFLVTSLRRCRSCQLLFRAPTTTPEENAAFYQSSYKWGFITDLPDDRRLKAFVDAGFAGTERDYSVRIDILRAAGVADGSRVLDFGCSWGYGSWQLKRSGFDVEGFEISAPRAQFARQKLGLTVHTSLADVPGPFDAVISCNVLEHVPSVGGAIRFVFGVLRAGGLFMAVTSNGSAGFRELSPTAWRKRWGFIHPNMLDDTFYRSYFAGGPILLASDPYPMAKLHAWAAAPRGVCVADQLRGAELLVLAKKV